MNKSFLFKLLLIYLLINPIFSATNPSSLQFPLDHGKHSDANQEWWSFFGHMMDANNNLYGFSLTFMRLSVPYQKPPSNWVTQDIYTSYFSITDSKEERFYYKEKINRTSFNFAGSNDSQLMLWNRGWQAIMNDKEITLKAQTNEVDLTLQLLPMKSPLLFGQNGLLENINLYYYALPKLQGHGKLKLGQNEFNIVSVLGDFDHAFQVQKNIDTVWDKFIIHLNNGDDFFLYIFSSKSSTFVYPDSFCIISHPDGTSVMLKFDDFQLTQSDSWHSQISNVTYPSSWILTIPKYHYRLIMKPTIKNQEVVTLNTTYWGGQSFVTGEKNGIPIQGYAYVEFSKQVSRAYLL